MKGKSYDSGGYKQRNKACLVYLESKMQQDRYGVCIFNLNSQQRIERT